MKKGHKAAKRATDLLERPDRMIGVILIGNNLVNTFAALLTTLIAQRLYGDEALFIAGLLLTLAILIFAEITPKTFAALHPEKLAFPFSLPLKALLKILYPAVWMVNYLSNHLVKILGVDPDKGNKEDHLNTEELRTIVDEAGELIPDSHQDMLINILDLEKGTVEDIMIPRNDVIGIDLEDSIETIIAQLEKTEYTKLPVYKGNINEVVGILHMRFTPRFLRDREKLTHKAIQEQLTKPYFVPESTELHQQLVNFKNQKHSMALVVDEYGDIQGLITLADLLEQIVGEFTTSLTDAEQPEIHPVEDNWYEIDGGASIRDINRNLDWNLPTDGAKTLNGLIVDYLEAIPQGHTSLIVNGYCIETTALSKTMVDSAKVKSA